MSERSISINGVTYLCSRDAAHIVQLPPDYISRLARADLIDGRSRHSPTRKRSTVQVSARPDISFARAWAWHSVAQPALAHIAASDAERRRAVPVFHSTATTEENIMKTIATALLALSVLAGIAFAPANADTSRFWQQQDKDRGSSGGP
jgi:hypothetical protein